MVDKLLEMGNGDITIGCLRGVDAGVIDSSFSPNKQVKDKVIGVKDIKGAIRWVELATYLSPKEVKKFHREKVAEREKALMAQKLTTK